MILYLAVSILAQFYFLYYIGIIIENNNLSNNLELNY